MSRFESPYGRSGESWFWRAWPDGVSYDFDGQAVHSRDFGRKSDAREFVASNGGGAIRRMRLRGRYSTETRTDSEEVDPS